MTNTYEVKDYIRSDCHRYMGDSGLITQLKLYLKSKAFRWQVAFRLCHCKGCKKLIGLLLWEMNRSKKSIQIYRTTDIGYGLYIGHSGPVVINPTVKIGNNCNLSQFTTIGTNSNNGAVIGDNVYIGPNVCIVENVHIGNNCTIGAGSVVTKDIPANATAAGNYAKVLNFNNPGRFVNNRWGGGIS